MLLIVQTVSGVLLTLGFTASLTADSSGVALAFQSVFSIGQVIEFGWLLRFVHINGASTIFAVLYLHILKGLQHGSYTLRSV